MVDLGGLSESLRQRVVASATGPFQHAPYPLSRTLAFPGDPGLFGPGSVSWTVIGDASTFAGGIRALLVQAAHPEVVAGVADHSRYREDPLGRLVIERNDLRLVVFDEKKKEILQWLPPLTTAN